MSAQKAPPIVAELGRPETPEETAARKAENSRKHRANQTRSTSCSRLSPRSASWSFLFAVVVRPDTAPPEPIDYVAVAESANADVPLAAPVVPADWYVERAPSYRTESACRPGRSASSPPTRASSRLVQGIDANVTWVTAEVDARTPDRRDPASADIDWQVYDHRDAADPGNFAYALVAEFDGSTVVLHGTASDAEFESLATAIAQGLAP